MIDLSHLIALTFRRAFDRIHWVFLSIAFCQLVAARGQPPTEPPYQVLVLKQYLAEPSDHPHRDVVEDVKYLLTTESAGEVESHLVQAFVGRWVTGEGEARIDLESFDDLVKVSGMKGSRFVDVLAETARLPKSWSDREFRHWFRGKLAELPEEGIALAKVNWSVEASQLGPCYTFLFDVLSDKARSVLWDHWSRTTWTALKAHQLESLQLGLLEAEAAITPSVNGIEILRNIRRLIGERLVDMGVIEWPLVGDVFMVFAQESGDVRRFLEKGSQHLREHEADRTVKMAALLNQLIRHLRDDAREEAVVSLAPTSHLSWFIWLHDSQLMESIYEGSPQHRQNGFQYLAQLSTEPANDVPQITRCLLQYFYDTAELHDSCFEILRNLAREGAAPGILHEALRDRLRAEHREILAMDALGDAELGLEQLQVGDTGQPRLGFAIAVFITLVDPDQFALTDELRRKHFGSPLLGSIVATTLQLLERGEGDRALAILGEMDFGKYLAQLGKGMTKLSDSAPLQQLVKAVRERLGDTVAPAGAASGEFLIDVEQFIIRMKTVLRLYQVLVVVSAEELDDWGDELITMLRTAFRVVEPQVSESPDARASRVAMLCELDEPLRKSLQPEGLDNGALREAREKVRNRIFSELYLPLAGEPGFLGELQARRPRDWPHLQWIATSTTRERDWREFCRALEKVPTLDADVAIASLAKAYLDGRSPWLARPEEIFGGCWSDNTGFRLWKRLLSDHPPLRAPAGLDALALRAVEHVEDMAARGESHNTVMSDVPWITHLLTAAEWQLYPCRDAFQRPAGGLIGTRDGERPFQQEWSGRELSRRVDPELRARFADALIKLTPVPETDHEADILLRAWSLIADVLLLLPNDPSNLLSNETFGNTSTGQGMLADVLSKKKLVHRQLYQLWQTNNGADVRLQVFRQLLRLEVSTRGADLGEPTLADLTQEYKEWAGSRVELLSELLDMLSERKELLDAIGSGDATENLRVSLTERLAAVPRLWSDEPGAGTEVRDFVRRLKELDDVQLGILFPLSKNLHQLCESYGHEGQVGTRNEQELLAHDSELVAGFLRWMDTYLWYLNDQGFMSEYLQDYGDEKGRRRALLILGLLKPEFQERILTICDRLEGAEASGVHIVSDEASADSSPTHITRRIRTALIQWNRVVFSVFDAIVSKDIDEAQRILETKHTIPGRSVLDLRLLAHRQQLPLEVSAKGLTKHCFAGILLNQRIASRPSNNPELSADEVEKRDILFKTRVFGTGDSTDVTCTDQIIRRAVLWSKLDHFPQLQEGARSFLATPHREIMVGAGSPRGLLQVLRQIVDNCSLEQDPRYGEFYEAALCDFSSETQQVEFSADFRRSFQDVLFSLDVSAQRQSIQDMIAVWRDAPALRSENVALVRVYRASFGSVISSLLQGEGRDGRSSIWDPALDFRHDSQVRMIDDPPVAFLDLATWASALPDTNLDPPHVINGLFATDFSPHVCLARIYHERCASEVQELAQTLSRRSDHVQQRLSTRECPVMLATIDELWNDRQHLIRHYQEMNASADKYTGWARSSHLPDIFLVSSTDLRHERWEGIRPLLISRFAADDGWGWNDPDGDGLAWQELSPIQREFEFLLLLQIATEGSSDYHQSWVARELGSEPLQLWLLDSQESRDFFQGEYSYTPLYPPSLDTAPLRAQAMLQALSWVRTSDRDSFFEFTQRKTFILLRMLELIAEHNKYANLGSHWFCLGARLFPFFGPFRPELTAEGDVRAVSEHHNEGERSLLVTLFDDERTPLHQALSLRDAILWCQVDRMSPSGIWEIGPASWTTWVPRGNKKPPSTRADQDLSDLNPSASEELARYDVHGMNANESAIPMFWQSVFDWASVVARDAEIIPTQKVLHVQLANSSGWQLGMPEDQCRESLATTGSISPRLVHVTTQPRGPPSGGAGFAIEIVDVDPERMLEVRLSSTDKLLVTRQFDVSEVWGPEFAWSNEISIWMSMASLTSWAALAILCTVLGITIWRSREILVSEKKIYWWLTTSAAFGIATTAILIGLGPVHKTELPYGGVVDFLIPSDDTVPNSLRELNRSTCLAAYRALSVHANASEKSIPSDRWASRLWSVLGRMVPSVSTDQVRAVVPADLQWVVRGLTFRVRTADASSRPITLGEGPLSLDGMNRFEEALDRVDYMGGPASLERLIRDDAAITLLIHDGDHGGLLARPPSFRSDGQPVVRLWQPNPSRDRNSEAGLDTRSRHALLSGTFVQTLLLAPEECRVLDPSGDFPDQLAQSLDASAMSPQEMQAYREAWWAPARDSQLIEEVIQRITTTLETSYQETYRPVAYPRLATRGLPWYWYLLTLVLVALPFSWQQRGMSSRTWYLKVIESGLTALIVVLFFASAIAYLERDISVLGDGLLESGRYAIWTLLGSLLATFVCSVCFWIGEISNPGDYSKKARNHHEVGKPSFTRWVIAAMGMMLVVIACIVWSEAPVLHWHRSRMGVTPSLQVSMLQGLTAWLGALTCLLVSLLWSPKHEQRV